ncbi:MAG: MaoC/PaaZ C-terminal domain-containing protein [Actinomycetota bacterium]
MGLNAALAGKRYETQTYAVTADAIHAYAAATNETNPAYTGADPLAPPAFPVVPLFATLANALFDPELEVNLTRLVHGEQEHVLHEPIRAGDVLSVDGMIESVEVKESGERFTVHGSLTNRDGRLVAEARSLMFIRGKGSRPKGAAPAAEQPPAPEYLFETAEIVDDDQTFRYAEASGDHNPIHLDADFAEGMAGLPGIILHGMCTMAFAARAVVDGLCGGDPGRLARIRVRFSRPVFPGQTINTRGWQEPGGTFAFETLNERGQTVITAGVAEVRS